MGFIDADAEFRETQDYPPDLDLAGEGGGAAEVRSCSNGGPFSCTENDGDSD